MGSRSAAQSLPAKRNKAEPVGCPVAVQHDDDDDDDDDDDNDGDEPRRGDFNCLSRHNTSGACKCCACCVFDLQASLVA